MDRKWCLMDLITGSDGKLVMTKLQAATFHAIMAATVLSISAVRIYKYFKSDVVDAPTLFDAAMWSIYAAAAIGHAVLDKTGAQVTAFKERKLEMENAPLETTSTESKTTTVKAS